MLKSLDEKLSRIHADPHGAKDFILADAKDADMALGIAATGKSPEAHAANGRFRSLAEYRDALPQMVNTPEVRFPCSEERKFAVVEEVRDRLKAEGAKVNDIDGVRVLTDDGWWLLRASNTQDVLVARCEAKDEAALSRLKAAVSRQLEASQIAAPPF